MADNFSHTDRLSIITLEGFRFIAPSAAVSAVVPSPPEPPPPSWHLRIRKGACYISGGEGTTLRTPLKITFTPNPSAILSDGGSMSATPVLTCTAAAATRHVLQLPPHRKLLRSPFLTQRPHPPPGVDVRPTPPHTRKACRGTNRGASPRSPP